ncbi:hypothetical protein [Ottowia sp. SB7-C50]|nr:hypothetical protein [Ottowia sp. SB7-C50]WOP14583.1 hypothetical protein R0D99_12095 [Ottowia sp. SB7-C50]
MPNPAMKSSAPADGVGGAETSEQEPVDLHHLQGRLWQVYRSRTGAN